MEKMTNALSNNVYYDKENNKIIKEYSPDKFKMLFGNQEANILGALNFNILKIENSKIELEYIDHVPFNDDEISLQDLIAVSGAIKSLHSVPFSNIKAPGFESAYKELLLKGSYPTVGYVDEFERAVSNDAFRILKTGKQVILHNDVVSGNLLKTNNGITLIDFEYGGLGNPIFDIASFLTERELTKEQQEMFISLCDANINRLELSIVCAFLQIFWARWALFKYESTNKEIYKEIANWKLNQYNEIKKTIA